MLSLPEYSSNKLIPEVSKEKPNPLALPTGCPYHPRCPFALECCKNEIPPEKEYAPGCYARCFNIVWLCYIWEASWNMAQLIRYSTIRYIPIARLFLHLLCHRIQMPKGQGISFLVRFQVRSTCRRVAIWLSVARKQTNTASKSVHHWWKWNLDTLRLVSVARIAINVENRTKRNYLFRRVY